MSTAQQSQAHRLDALEDRERARDREHEQRLTRVETVVCNLGETVGQLGVICAKLGEDLNTHRIALETSQAHARGVRSAGGRIYKGAQIVVALFAGIASGHFLR